VFLVDSRNYVDRELAFYGDFEREQIAFLLTAMRRAGCDLFIDIGANIGLYSVLAAKVAGRVVAFEPDERSLPQLRANLAMNCVSHVVDVQVTAISDRPAQLPFCRGPETSTGQSRVAESADMTVPAARLDDILDVAGLTIFLKIDIEGHELRAIAGMGRLLTRNRCILQVESFGSNAADLAYVLAASGFRVIKNIGDEHFFANFQIAL
jgi:FkbM family methyltransferase